MTCPACGAPLVEGARFCASCGQPVSRRGDERRVVTVLFADLVGFTTLSETSDPEQVKNLVDACFQRLVVDINAFGGQVDKIIGDAILALFGAPTAHEDDAERAVRAALQMQQTIEHWCGETGAQLRMRVGINTGEVLVGALRAGGDYTAMGDVVNTAQRLQTLAQPGQVVVGPAAHAATRHCVRYTPLGLLQARGREEPVETFLAEEVLLPPGARPGRGATPLVGRDTELALLTRAIETAVTRRRAQMLLVMADAGIGKTRLAEEAAAVAQSDHGVNVLEGRCVPYGEANAWWPVAEALRATCTVSVDDDIATAKTQVLARVREGMPLVTAAEVERVSTGLLHVMGYDTGLRAIEPTRAREEVLRSLVAFIEGFARQRPVVVLLSDLHWADDRVLQLGDAILERLANLPVVLLCTGRHALFERWQPRVGRHNQLVLNLDPLSRDAAGALLDAMVESSLPDDLREALLDRSGGNPFFLEELVALLAEGTHDDVTRPRQTELPHTLRGLVAARLDSLTTAERSVLDDAAVLGRRSTVEALQLMAEHAHGTSPDISEALDGLVAKDVLVVDDGKWSFRSDLVREVAYGMLTKVDRAKRHYGIAKWNELHRTGDPVEVDRIAHHFTVAAQLLSEVGAASPEMASDALDRALVWLEQAIHQAEDGELHQTVRRLADDGLELVSLARPPAGAVDPSVHGELLLARARAKIAMRDLPEARCDLDAAEPIISDAGDRRAHGELLLVRGELEQKLGDLETSRTTLRDAASAYRAIDDERGLAEALRTAGMTELFADDLPAAEAAFADALESFKRIGDRRGEAWVLQNLAWVAYQRGDAEVAEAWLTESIDVFTEIGDSGGLGWAMGLMAFVRFHQGRFTEAEALATNVVGEAQQRGDVWGEGMCRALLGLLALWSGRTNLGISHGRDALELFRDMSDWYGEQLSAGIVGRGLVAAGEVDDGFKVIEASAATAAALDSQPAMELAIVNRVCAAAQAGTPDRAGESLAGDIPPDQIGAGDLFVAESLLLVQEGDAATARERLEVAVASQGDHGREGYAGAALALVRAAAGAPAEALDAALAVLGAEKATYADRVLAAIGAGLGAAQRDDHPRANAMLRTAQELADVTEDVMLQAVVRLADARARLHFGEANAPEAYRRSLATLASMGVSQPGWDTAFRLAVGAP